MRANDKFLNLPKHFWANVRTISQSAGYSIRGKNLVCVPTLDAIKTAFQKIELSSEHICTSSDRVTPLGQTLQDYFEHRAACLNSFVEPNLMDVEEAKSHYENFCKTLKPSCPLPMNKQKGDKRAPAYLTCIVNMILESTTDDIGCNYDPRELTTIVADSMPVRTLARRVDGAFPSIINPIAIWEIKEYYYTTTFGSRVADGVYETLLDGLELAELFESEKIKVEHVLILDAHFTWWKCGKSYLCRIIDMLHMGLVDEVLFGREVIDRLPVLTRSWVNQFNKEK